MIGPQYNWRDPRIDPRVGDELKDSDGCKVLVTAFKENFVSGKTYVSFYVTHPGSRALNSTRINLDEWRKSAAEVEVLTVAAYHPKEVISRER